MNIGSANRRGARIIGGGLILGVGLLAIWLQSTSWRESTDAPDRTIKAARAPASPVSPRLKLVPQEHFPLTLGNEPAASGAGVVNADHSELEFLEDNDAPRMSPMNPYMAESLPTNDP